MYRPGAIGASLPASVSERSWAEIRIRPLRHGIPSVGRQVQDGQFQLVDIGQHRRKRLGKVGLNVYRRADGALQQTTDALHQCRQLDRFGGQFLSAGEREHPLRQRDTAQRALGGVIQQLDEFRIAGHALAHNFQVAEDHRQQVIEVMGDASGELADGLQFL